MQDIGVAMMMHWSPYGTMHMHGLGPLAPVTVDPVHITCILNRARYLPAQLNKSLSKCNAHTQPTICTT